jgi:hypothetical protein
MTSLERECGSAITVEGVAKHVAESFAA